MLLVGIVTLGSVVSRRPLAVIAAVALVVGVISGWGAAMRRSATAEAVVPVGPIELVGQVTADPRPGPQGVSFAMRPSALRSGTAWLEWQGPRLRIDAAEVRVAAGEPVRVAGSLAALTGRFRGDVVAGQVRASDVERLGAAPSPLMRTGNALRARVLGALDAGAASPSGALLSGFLVGAVEDLPKADFEALRRTGLSHFVAVSGSNVALFLAGWWLVTGPLGWGPRRRAAVGLLGVALFVVITRWEPSVVRAGAMAGFVLVGRGVGIAVSPWTALGSAVAASLAVSGELAFDLGFQLSVAATAGIIVGSPMWVSRTPRWAWTALGATISAQVAVAPLLLARFGTVPLLAPVANLVAAPLVAAATSVGGLGVLLGMRPLTEAGTMLAGWVLAIARGGAHLPQIGLSGSLMGGAALLAAGVRRARPWLGLGTAVMVAVLVVPQRLPPQSPTAYFLDVGQGDATLLRGPEGEVVLVDGGPDPLRLADLLRSHGVSHVDLLVVSHGHADHAGGLEGITASQAIGTVWLPDQLGEGLALDGVVDELRTAGVDIRFPTPGWMATVGGFHVEVLGPLRRYASPNDGSIVLRVTWGGTTVLLPGDIEAVAQRELGPLRSDVMKVPHQGAATSDPEWLTASAPRLAVISVGPNDFGHPSSEVVAALEGAGAVVRRTDLEGTIGVRLDRMSLEP